MRSKIYFTLSLTLLSTVLHAQLGVSPSQNASFLRELRARDSERADEARDVLGDDRQALERGRELSRPEIFSFSTAAADRLSSDITGLNGQYQLGRKWFSPFYFGVEAPAPFVENKEGLTLGMALEMTTEYNSAVNGGKGGTIFSPTLLCDGSYQITPEQQLTFSGGLGLNWISGNNRIDTDFWSDEFGFTVLPGTSLAYDLDLDRVHVTLYDRVSALTYVGVVQNDLGIAATVALTEQLSWTLNYTYSTTVGMYDTIWPVYPRGSQFDLHTVSSELVFKPSSTLSFGLEGAWNWYLPENATDDYFIFPPGIMPWWMPFDGPSFESEFMNVGLFVNWSPNQDFNLRLAVGYQHYTTPRSKGPTFFFFKPTLNIEEDTPYYSLSLSHRLSKNWSHELAAGYERVLVLGGEYQLAHYANYGLTGKVWEGAQFTSSLFYEHIDTPNINFMWDNETTNAGIDLHLTQRLTSKLHLDLGYSFLETYFDGVQAFRQQMGSVGFRYALSPKTQVTLGYQGFLMHSNGDPLDQHRGILSIRQTF